MRPSPADSESSSKEGSLRFRRRTLTELGQQSTRRPGIQTGSPTKRSETVPKLNRTTSQVLLEACQKLFALALAPALFNEDKKRKILGEARDAILFAQAERN